MKSALSCRNDHAFLPFAGELDSRHEAAQASTYDYSIELHTLFLLLRECVQSAHSFINP